MQHGKPCYRNLRFVVSASLVLVALCVWSQLMVARRAHAAANAGTRAAQAALATPTPAENGRIAFVSDRDGNAEIYSIESDGTGLINLTNNPAQDGTPAWSPDGARLAFASNRGGISNIYVMNANGTGVTQITHNDGTGTDIRVYDPAWSPDGTKLVYVSSLQGELSSLIVVNADGSGIGKRVGFFSEVADPAWSPDGTKIACVAREGFANPEDGIRFFLFVVNVDGSGQTQVAAQVLTFDSFAFPPDASGPTWSPDNARLAFVSTRDGNPELYSVSASGGPATRLTNNSAADTTPAWSPDGFAITFTSTRDGNAEIYTMGANGDAQTRLTNNSARDYDPDWQWRERTFPTPYPTPSLFGTGRLAFLKGEVSVAAATDIYVIRADGGSQVNLTNSQERERAPAWSPDATKIAFARDRALYVMNADGTNVKQIAPHVADPFIKPAWSPDGVRIAFINGSDLDYHIAVVNADGTNLKVLPINALVPTAVAWSPDGARLAYVSDRFAGFGNTLISVINADGTGGAQLTQGTNIDFEPAWSPDGTRLAFTSRRDGNLEVYVMNADGSGQTNLTNNPANDREPTWQPEGGRLAFTSDRDGNPEIYEMFRDGGGQIRLTNDVRADSAPDWQPTPLSASASTIQWRNPSFRVRESNPSGDAPGYVGDRLTVTRLGDHSGAASVDFTTADATASDRSDYMAASGTIHFAPGEAERTIKVALVDDAYVEGDETAYLLLTNAQGAALGGQRAVQLIITDNDTAPPTRNPADDISFFVRQHYLDFLGREPDQAGFNDWTGVLNRCPDLYNAPACDRVTVSAAFFGSQEFQLKGYFVYRFYAVAYGARPGYAEFVRDLRRVSGATAAEVNANRSAFTAEFVARTDFQRRYSGTNNADYVDRLLQSARVQLPTRNELIAALDNGTKTRADVLREIVESGPVFNLYFNEAFVTMQYFGYLHRDPDLDGYRAWLNYLSAHPTDFRTMVRGFVDSREYRQRFGPP